jgi:hypothetical protein
MLERDFTHVANFTGYMGIVFELVQSVNQPQRILDVPAGNGVTADTLGARRYLPGSSSNTQFAMAG